MHNTDPDPYLSIIIPDEQSGQTYTSVENESENQLTIVCSKLSKNQSSTKQAHVSYPPLRSFACKLVLNKKATLPPLWGSSLISLRSKSYLDIDPDSNLFAARSCSELVKIQIVFRCLSRSKAGSGSLSRRNPGYLKQS